MKAQAEFECVTLKVNGQEPSFCRVACLFASVAEPELASISIDPSLKARKLSFLTSPLFFLVGGFGDCSEPQESRKQVTVAVQEGMLLACDSSKRQS